jgi:hypothetical protein
MNYEIVIFNYNLLIAQDVCHALGEYQLIELRPFEFYSYKNWEISSQMTKFGTNYKIVLKVRIEMLVRLGSGLFVKFVL